MRRPRRARKSPGRISRGEFIAGTEKRETTPRAEIFTLGRTDFKPVSCGALLLRLPVAFALQHARRNPSTLDTALGDLTLGTDMRVLLACAIIISAAIGMGGCWWHHQAAVVTQPAPPLK